jgi:hypothetical protein
MTAGTIGTTTVVKEWLIGKTSEMTATTSRLRR